MITNRMLHELNWNNTNRIILIDPFDSYSQYGLGTGATLVRPLFKFTSDPFFVLTRPTTPSRSPTSAVLQPWPIEPSAV